MAGDLNLDWWLKLSDSDIDSLSRGLVIAMQTLDSHDTAQDKKLADNLERILEYIRTETGSRVT